MNIESWREIERNKQNIKEISSPARNKSSLYTMLPVSLPAPSINTDFVKLPKTISQSSRVLMIPNREVETPSKKFSVYTNRIGINIGKNSKPRRAIHELNSDIDLILQKPLRLQHSRLNI